MFNWNPGTKNRPEEGKAHDVIVMEMRKEQRGTSTSGESCAIAKRPDARARIEDQQRVTTLNADTTGIAAELDIVRPWTRHAATHPPKPDLKRAVRRFLHKWFYGYRNDRASLK